MRKLYLQIIYDASKPSFKEDVVNISQMIFPYHTCQEGSDSITDRLIGNNPVVNSIRVEAEHNELSDLLIDIGLHKSVKEIKQSENQFSEKEIRESANYS
jgi:hypothetical protein|tara:strand:- start:2342 stop:2641 length:300 start_codon:yes stop_codon:yes gene_type:complete